MEGPVAGDKSLIRRPKASSDSVMSRRIRAANISRKSGLNPPSTSMFFVTRTWPPSAGSMRCSKITFPSGMGHSLTQRRSGSTSVIVNVPPRFPRCLAHPDAPVTKGPSSRAISLVKSHSGQPGTSVQTFHTAAGSAPNVASHWNEYTGTPPEPTAPVR
jgi:hypothetical protein